MIYRMWARVASAALLLLAAATFSALARADDESSCNCAASQTALISNRVIAWCVWLREGAPSVVLHTCACCSTSSSAIQDPLRTGLRSQQAHSRSWGERRPEQCTHDMPAAGWHALHITTRSFAVSFNASAPTTDANSALKNCFTSSTGERPVVSD